MRTDFAPSRSRQVAKEAQSRKDDVGAWVARINGQGLKRCHHARRGRSSSLAPSVEVSYPGFRRNTDAPGRSYSLESKAKSRHRLAGKVNACGRVVTLQVWLQTPDAMLTREAGTSGTREPSLGGSTKTCQHVPFPALSELRLTAPRSSRRSFENASGRQPVRE